MAAYMQGIRMVGRVNDAKKRFPAFVPASPVCPALVGRWGVCWGVNPDNNNPVHLLDDSALIFQLARDSCHGL